MTPGINSGVTISAIPDGIGYPYGLEILVLMTPGINRLCENEQLYIKNVLFFVLNMIKN